MIKKYFFLPSLMLALLLTSCEDENERPVSGLGTIPAEYQTSREDVKATLLEIYPSEEVMILSGAEQTDGGPKTDHLTVEFINPEEFPDNDSLLNTRIEDIREEATNSIENIDEYRKLVIVFQEKMEENGLSKSRSIQKEISIGGAE